MKSLSSHICNLEFRMRKEAAKGLTIKNESNGAPKILAQNVQVNSSEDPACTLCLKI